MNIETVKLLISVATALLAIASFVIARQSDVRSKKAESIKQLLREKESVSFAAIKLLREGLPSVSADRQLYLSALMQACVFEGSDRARALLYRVIELNRDKYHNELQNALKTISDTFDGMDLYQFSKVELDLTNGRLRIAAVKKVIDASYKPL